MKITPRGGAAITLVDPAISAFQPIPAVSYQQRLAQYDIIGGKSHSYALGGALPDVAPALVLIDQATDAAAIAVLLALKTAILDDQQQPMSVQWNDAIAGPWDGWYFISVSAPEVYGEFPGRIGVTLTMRPADPT